MYALHLYCSEGHGRVPCSAKSERKPVLDQTEDHSMEEMEVVDRENRHVAFFEYS